MRQGITICFRIVPAAGSSCTSAKIVRATLAVTLEVTMKRYAIVVLSALVNAGRSNKGKGTVMYEAVTPEQFAQALRDGFDPQDPNIVLSTPETVADYMRPRFAEQIRETIWSIGLNSRLQPVVEILVGAGTADHTTAHAREVFAPAMYRGAVKIIIAHNHPSGSMKPSDADIMMTERLSDAGHLLCVPIIDHVIVTDYGFYSFRKEGRLG